MEILNFDENVAFPEHVAFLWGIQSMQVVQFGVSMPGILATGFLIGVILIILGSRENQNLERRNHLIGLGTIVIGIMIPVTPLSWYLYWVGIIGLLILGGEPQIVTLFALVIGIIVIYQGIRIYRRKQ